MTFDFDSFWLSGPWLKLRKKTAHGHFKQSVKTADDWNKIQAARDAYIVDLRLNPWKHPQHGSTWFNNWRELVPDVEERVEALADDPINMIGSDHYHLCRICDPEHQWKHFDIFCWMSHEVICDVMLAKRKKK